LRSETLENDTTMRLCLTAAGSLGTATIDCPASERRNLRASLYIEVLKRTPHENTARTAPSPPMMLTASSLHSPVWLSSSDSKGICALPSGALAPPS
jgi:hypothetical protein